MLFRKQRPVRPIHSETDIYLSSEVVGNGTIVADSDVHIDGVFNGAIQSPGLVEISKNARAKADITARALVVDGFLKGSAKISEEIAIHGSAEVQAQLESASLVVEKNALITGSVKVVR